MKSISLQNSVKVKNNVAVSASWQGGLCCNLVVPNLNQTMKDLIAVYQNTTLLQTICNNKPFYKCLILTCFV